ncbi:MFS transporter [Beijerinckia indica]|uniref:Major facilitator superfamily MFS_1 n=1 Tax=Beijerinckia indica subsp. indica (strain ATCC 9039 / DSM 1715 / NCIMB 8712) TaxID=395963 RepID=B2IHP0_BEII9|nr:MFS transporter [Beijerinckia indica]ACB94561.1 major facilitator superfamily MFS_1 [Beijerinckia indica subsp. indica ATCC 9039]
MSAGGKAKFAVKGLSPALTLACAVACGTMVANLYYAQPLVDLIAPDLGLDESYAGLIVTLTQLGYGAGLLLLVPLADCLDNRRLILSTLLATAVALVGVATAPSEFLFLVATILVGVCASGAQVIVPFTASLVPEEIRGQTIGNVMAGLLTGIMLARPAASLIANYAGWRAVFWISSGLMLLLFTWLAKTLPSYRLQERDHYSKILRSMGHILVSSRPLQRRAIYQGIAFMVFNLFWTASPLVLTHRFDFDQKDIALFALAGAGGALAAPVAGRLGDRGYVRAGTAVALSTITLSCLFSGFAVSWHWLTPLVIFAVTLDAAVQLNQILSQRVIFSLPGHARGRLNAIYMTIVFLLGAMGSAVATFTYHEGGWWMTALTGTGLGLLVTGLFATEWVKPTKTHKLKR